jgi:hypothetical protein
MLWFGELFSFYKSENRLALGFEAIRIARVTLFALCLVFLTYNPKYQLGLIIATQFSYLAALVAIRPYKESHWLNIIEMITEALVLVGSALLAVFVDSELSDDNQVAVGWSLVVVFSVVIFATTLLIVWQFGLTIRQPAKRLHLRSTNRRRTTDKTLAIAKESTNEFTVVNVMQTTQPRKGKKGDDEEPDTGRSLHAPTGPWMKDDQFDFGEDIVGIESDMFKAAPQAPDRKKEQRKKAVSFHH